MANALSMPDFNAAVQGGFQQGQSMAQQGVRRNALSSIAGALNENDYASAGNAAAQLGDPELVLQIKTLKQQGEQAKIDALKAKAGAIRETLAVAEQYRMSNPGNFPQVAQGLAAQFVQMNPELGYSPEQVLQTLLDPAQGQAALASVMGIEGAISQANTEFEQELKLRDADRKDRQQDETERKNRVSEDLQRQTLDQTQADKEGKRDAADAKQAELDKKAENKRQSTISDLQETKALIGRIRDHKGFKVAIGAPLAFQDGKVNVKLPFGGVPGSAQRDVDALIETLKARLGFGTLQEMRNNSPTGGALGQVSEKELAFLQNAEQSLRTSQSEEQFKENLNLIEQSLDRLLAVQGVASGGSISEAGIDPAALTPDDLANMTDEQLLEIENLLKGQ